MNNTHFLKESKFQSPEKGEAKNEKFQMTVPDPSLQEWRERSSESKDPCFESEAGGLSIRLAFWKSV
jgi:hypothetical protein